MKTEHVERIRVRYGECDPMGVVHHAVYPIWMEIARTEALRAAGLPYAELEAGGMLIVVVKMDLTYRRSAKYDELIDVTATLRRAAGVRIEHDYQIRRGSELLVTASTTLACLDRTGKIIAIPEALHYDP